MCFDKLAEVSVDKGGIVGVGVVTGCGNIDQRQVLAFGPVAAVAQAGTCTVVFAYQEEHRTAFNGGGMLLYCLRQNTIAVCRKGAILSVRVGG